MRADTPEAQSRDRVVLSNLNNQKYSNIIEFTATEASGGRLLAARGSTIKVEQT